MPDQGNSPNHCFHPWLPLKGFKAYRIEHGVPAAVSFARRDIYQVCLVTAKSRVCYSEKETEGNGHVLVFTKPNAAYSWGSNSQGQPGYNCLFTNEFLSKHPRLMSLLTSPLFGLGDIVVYPLTRAQNKSMAAIFQQILGAQDSHYVFKHELIVDCLYWLTHEALKMQSPANGNRS
jgi:hypothetical protein